jgi:autotransporter-associated beta strand protein
VSLGGGIFTLSGVNIYSGPTLVSAGTLQAGSVGAFSPNSAFTVNAIVDLNGNSNTIGSLAGTGTVINNGATPATLTAGGDGTSTLYSGSMVDGTSTLGLIKAGPGTLILSGLNTYSGGTVITAGVLQIGNGGITGSITGDVTDDATLAFDRSDALTFGGVVSGPGGLSQLGAGTLILTGNNLYTGVTTIGAGILQVGNGGTSGALSGGSIINNAILDFDRSDSITYGGVISGSGVTIKDGSGTLILTGANTYSGGTAINSGTLQLGNGGASGRIVGPVV